MALQQAQYPIGEAYAMAGANREHNLLVGNSARLLGNHLQNSPYATFSSDLKVKAGPNFFYPDVMVVCDDENVNDYYTDRPTIIVEILSKAARRIDKSVKLTAYRGLASLQEYVLIETDHVEIEVFRRSTDWRPAHYFLGDAMSFDSIGLSVAVADLYQRVNNEDMRDYLQQIQQQQQAQ
ncbi:MULTISPECIES: Uma2 family endonuclease [Methylomonas]|uniref:Uncharacterized protein n=1 Tax=Methylomonas koyamae TaxID=702114 RepID=A0A291IFL0_9GAMM|nr:MULTISPECIES: Uma2 family endonuclease [Methylomonas]ANE54311.1 hypothetical protein AYM39_03315 [Methylomonas sp. DH-1]ATG88978.1 hypothetical protein MKLM6_0703 [Methylomonas koyamae]OAI28584.1 hypothetical protein A1356_06920 [Methylomonas koyamae]